MNAYRLPNGNLLVPRRADAEGGILGDGLVEVGPDDAEFQQWEQWYEARGEEPPDARSDWPEKTPRLGGAAYPAKSLSPDDMDDAQLTLAARAAGLTGRMKRGDIRAALKETASTGVVPHIKSFTSDSGEAAHYYASLFSLLEQSGCDPATLATLADVAAEELAGSGWALEHSSSGWHAIDHTQKALSDWDGKAWERRRAPNGWSNNRWVNELGRVIYSADDPNQRPGRARKPPKATPRTPAASVDVDAIRALLAPHTGESLTPAERKSASAAWALFRRHHGANALHRVEELARAVNETGKKATGGKLMALSREMAKFSYMMGLAERDGVTGVVAEKPVEQPPAADVPATEPATESSDAMSDVQRQSDEYEAARTRDAAIRRGTIRPGDTVDVWYGQVKVGTGHHPKKKITVRIEAVEDAEGGGQVGRFRFTDIKGKERTGYFNTRTDRWKGPNDDQYVTPEEVDRARELMKEGNGTPASEPKVATDDAAASARRSAVRAFVASKAPGSSDYRLRDLEKIAGWHDTLAGAMLAAEHQGILSPRGGRQAASGGADAWYERVLRSAYQEKEAATVPEPPATAVADVPQAGPKQPHEMTQEEFYAHSLANLKEIRHRKGKGGEALFPHQEGQYSEAHFRQTAGAAHQGKIAAAIAAGQPVPAAVIRDYPDLLAQHAATVTLTADDGKSPFTGTLTDSAGRKYRFVDGKRVKGTEEPVAATELPATKEPWEMTRHEWENLSSDEKRKVLPKGVPYSALSYHGMRAWAKKQGKDVLDISVKPPDTLGKTREEVRTAIGRAIGGQHEITTDSVLSALGFYGGSGRSSGTVGELLDYLKELENEGLIQRHEPSSGEITWSPAPELDRHQVAAMLSARPA